MLKVLGIQRAERFSPNSVDKDLAILDAVVKPFGGKIVSEDDNKSLISALSIMPDVVFSMARSEDALSIISDFEEKGIRVINPSEGVRRCQRSRLDKIMKEHNLPVPKEEGSKNGYWLKRGDAAAQSHEDVVFCKDDEALAQAKKQFMKRGITDMIVQAHVPGDLVKFYGVEGTGFFRTYYPSDDGKSKFGDEEINGKAHHYFYQKEYLQAIAEQTSRLVKTPVYGGDAIIDANGEFVIIDFNDWPSFSRCREEAAKAIASLARY